MKPLPRAMVTEFEQIPRLEEVGVALTRFAMAISNSYPCCENEQWVFRPENFCTFNIQYKRAQHVSISLRGAPREFLQCDEQRLTDSMGNGAYSKFYLESPAQLAMAAMHVRRAYDLWTRGRSRRRTRLVLREV